MIDRPFLGILLMLGFCVLAPMQYLEIPIGTVIGYLIFKDLPNGLAALGICITIAAGLYIILRERAMSRALPVPPVL